MEGMTAAARQRYDDVLRAGSRLVVALDYDGTLAPIVEDPREARIAPGAQEVLTALAPLVRALAVITGRPAQQVLDLGGLDEIGDVSVFGQYGNERWDTGSTHVSSAPPPEGLAGFLSDLSGLLRTSGLDPYVEEKGIAVAVHTRSLGAPQAAYDALLPLLTATAHEHGLRVEPGRYVIEVRGEGMDKGRALRSFVDETGAGGVVYVGDDLGDLDAFDAVEDLRARGMPGLLVCARPPSDSEVVERADVHVPGPAGVLALLRQLTADLAAAGE